MTRALANRIMFILSLAGFCDSLYLTMAHAQLVELKCGPSHGCEEVAHSAAAMGMGIPFLSNIPTAAFGILMYLALAAGAFLRAATDNEVIHDRVSKFQWAISLVSVLASGYLTYLEAYVIHAWCRYCVVSAIIILIHFIFASIDRSMARKSNISASIVEGEIS